MDFVKGCELLRMTRKEVAFPASGGRSEGQESWAPHELPWLLFSVAVSGPPYSSFRGPEELWAKCSTAFLSGGGVLQGQR